MPPSEPSELLAPVTLGRYRLIKKIAVGGMAEIYLATMTGFGGFEKHVVVKRILPQLATDDELYRMFLDEARIAATLQHPNIVQVFDAGEDGAEHYIAMEFLDGADLQTLRATLAQRKKGVPMVHTIHIVNAVAAGLHYAHDKLGGDGKPLGIVHRDVTPANIILTRDGGIKLVDFGIAKASNRLSRTSYGTLKGKLAFMSPEQVRGDEVDRRSDVYSLGIILYELTTGKRLYHGKSEYVVLKEIVEGEIPRPSALHPRFPRDLEKIILRALAKAPDQRFQSAREMGHELEQFARRRRLMMSSIGLSEFLTPILAEAQVVAASRRERVKAGVRRLTAPPPPPGKPPTLPPPTPPRPRALTEALASAERDLADGVIAEPLDGAETEAQIAPPLHREPERTPEPAEASETEPSATPVPASEWPLAGELAHARQRGAPHPADEPEPLTFADVSVDFSGVSLKRARSRRGLLALALVAAAVVVAIAVRHRGHAPSDEAAPPPATVLLSSDPPGAAVWLSLGRTPATTPALDPARTYLVRVEEEGLAASELTLGPAAFAAHRASLTLAPTATALAEPTATVDLGPLASRTAPVRIESEPGAASAWLYLGTTPTHLAPADAARLELRFTHAGYAPDYRVVEAATVADGGELRVEGALRPLPPPPPHGAKQTSPPATGGKPSASGAVVRSPPPGP